MEENILIDETISLSPFQGSDKENLLRYMNDPVLYKNTLRIPHPYKEVDADEWLSSIEQSLEKYGQTVNWAIRHRDAGMIGGIGCFMKTGWEGHNDEIGYWLAAPFRGRGIMTRIVQIYSDHLLASRPPLVRLEAWVFAHNPASMRILKKAGFLREGYARKLHVKNGEYIDAILLARIRE